MAGALQRFEKRLEGAVNFAFTRAFRSSVQPVEIAAALQREISAKAQIVSRQRTLVPNDFIVQLAPEDYDRITPFGSTLSTELSQVVHEHVRDQGYTLSGPLRISFEKVEELRTGSFEVVSTAKVGVHTPAQQYAAPVTSSGTTVWIQVNEENHQVRGNSFIIGRGTEADLRIDDPGISRRHAEFRIAGNPQNPTVTVTDLGSTNGVLVDERRVETSVVTDNSRVRLGTTTLIVRIKRNQ